VSCGVIAAAKRGAKNDTFRVGPGATNRRTCERKRLRQPGHTSVLPSVSSGCESVAGERTETGENEISELAITVDGRLQVFWAQPADGHLAKTSGVATPWWRTSRWRRPTGRSRHVKGPSLNGVVLHASLRGGGGDA